MGKLGRSARLFADLTSLERALLDNLKELGMTLMSAAALNLTLARASRDRFDTSRLSRDEQIQLDHLLSKAKTNGV